MATRGDGNTDDTSPSGHDVPKEGPKWEGRTGMRRIDGQLAIDGTPLAATLRKLGRLQDKALRPGASREDLVT